MVTPALEPHSLYVAIGIIGATVMPHNLFLHATQMKMRLQSNSSKSRLLKIARIDTFVALSAAWMVNSAILIMSAAVFFRNAHVVTEIDGAYRTLIPLVGSLAGVVFAIALLASGISSSVTGTIAGQIVMEEFLHLKITPWKRRIMTRLIVMVPALIAVGLGIQPLRLLVFSQVTLALLLPVAIVPLVDFTRRTNLMRELRNSRLTTALAAFILAGLITINLLVLYQQ
jgi:manganese transport protein